MKFLLKTCMIWAVWDLALCPLRCSWSSRSELYAAFHVSSRRAARPAPNFTMGKLEPVSVYLLSKTASFFNSFALALPEQDKALPAPFRSKMHRSPSHESEALSPLQPVPEDVI